MCILVSRPTLIFTPTQKVWKYWDLLLVHKQVIYACIWKKSYLLYKIILVPGLTLETTRAKKSLCEGWLRFLVGQKRSSSRLVILKSRPRRLWKCRYHVYWNLLCPSSILKVIFLNTSTLCNAPSIVTTMHRREQTIY
jgi:hypothetical protein